MPPPGDNPYESPSAAEAKPAAPKPHRRARIASGILLAGLGAFAAATAPMAYSVLQAVMLHYTGDAGVPMLHKVVIGIHFASGVTLIVAGYYGWQGNFRWCFILSSTGIPLLLLIFAFYRGDLSFILR